MVSHDGNKLILQLIRKQGKESNSRFARRLNVARTLWSQIRNGQRQVGLLLLIGTVQRFPDLEPDVIDFLRNGNEPS